MTSYTKTFQCHEPATLTSCIWIGCCPFCLLCVCFVVTANARRSASEQTIIIPPLHPPFLSFPWGFGTCPFHTPESLSPPSKCSATWSLAEGQPSQARQSRTEIRPPAADKTFRFSGDDELMPSVTLLSTSFSWADFSRSFNFVRFGEEKKCTRNSAASKKNRLRAKTKSCVAGHGATKLAAFRPISLRKRNTKTELFCLVSSALIFKPFPSRAFIRCFSLHPYVLWH